MAEMGFIPAGAYRNREYVKDGIVHGTVSLAMQDILYDPQTSGGLLMALPEKDAAECLKELNEQIPNAAIVGYVTEKEEQWIVLES